MTWPCTPGQHPSRAAEVLKLVTEELDKMAASGLTNEELAAAKIAYPRRHRPRVGGLGGQDEPPRARPSCPTAGSRRWPSSTPRLPPSPTTTWPGSPRPVLGGPRSLVVLGPFDDDAFPDWDGRAKGRPSGAGGPRPQVGVFGAAGRMGVTVCDAVGADPDLELVAVVDPAHAGEN